MLTCSTPNQYCSDMLNERSRSRSDECKKLHNSPETFITDDQHLMDLPEAKVSDQGPSKE